MMAVGSCRWFVLAINLLLLANQANGWWLFSNDKDNKDAAAGATSTGTGVNAAAKAVASFDMDGVKGSFKFQQANPSEPTQVDYDLTGLKGNNQKYHVHVRPVPPFDAQQVRQNATLLESLCGDPATGGHLNPHHVTQKLPPKSAPFDKYETGDLSGKHGPLSQLVGHGDHYVGSFKDDKLPMTGEHSIVGRSIVIHKNDGKRWVCASIVAVA